MLEASQRLRRNLDQKDSDHIRILFLQDQNLEQSCLIHLARSWSHLNSLSLGSNQIRFIKELHQCSFPELTELCLKNNQIQSIEPLCLLDIPKLKKLSLSFYVFMLGGNKINSIRSLRKSRFPQLTEISLYKNVIRECQSIFEMKAPCLNAIYLQYSNNKTVGEDLRWVFKIQSSEVKIGYFKSMNRIKIQSISQALLKKFPDLEK